MIESTTEPISNVRIFVDESDLLHLHVDIPANPLGVVYSKSQWSDHPEYLPHMARHAASSLARNPEVLKLVWEKSAQTRTTC